MNRLLTNAPSCPEYSGDVQAARAGAFGPHAQAYAQGLDQILGVGLTLATYAPEVVFEPTQSENPIDSICDSTGALPDFAREHPGFLAGRAGSGIAISIALSPPIGLSVAALSSYGSGILAVQHGSDVVQGMLLGTY
jgi:hypothetical protein